MRILLPFLALLMSFSLKLTGAEFPIGKGDVVVAPLKGEISDAQFFFLRRSMKAAEASGASAFIVEMDTPGGRMSTAVKILNLLLKSSIPTIVYVNDNAGSAGALIALGSKSIYMAPVSAIGAAAPVTQEGQDIPATMNEKIISYYSGYFRSAAQKNGYNPDVAQAFIDKDKEVKIGNIIINPKGRLLTLSAQEAIHNYDGKPLLVKGIAGSISELVKMAGLSGTVVVLSPSGLEKFALFITTLAPLLLLGGIIGAYIEMKMGGFGVAGIFSAVCFLLFFAGHYIAGLTGYEAVAVFILGSVLVILEIAFFPGHGLMVFSGLILIIGALFFAMMDYFPGQRPIPDFPALYVPIRNLGIAVGLSAVVIAIIGRYLPDLPIFRRLVLKTQPSFGPSHSMSEGENFVSVGTVGIALTILRPAGKAEFEGRLVDVVTEGGFIENGKKICVVEAGRDRIVVRSV